MDYANKEPCFSGRERYLAYFISRSEPQKRSSTSLAKTKQTSYDKSAPRAGWYVDDGVWEINPEEFGPEHLVRAPDQTELYHWAPRSAREGIAANGLQPSAGGADLFGVYLTGTPKDWAALHETEDETEEADLWIVNAQGLELFYDPEMMGGADTDFVHLAGIPSERLLGLANTGH